MAAWTGVQNSKPAWDMASRTGSESEGLRSEKRVLVSALLWLSESVSMISELPPFFSFSICC